MIFILAFFIYSPTAVFGAPDFFFWIPGAPLSQRAVPHVLVAGQVLQELPM